MKKVLSVLLFLGSVAVVIAPAMAIAATNENAFAVDNGDDSSTISPESNVPTK